MLAVHGAPILWSKWGAGVFTKLYIRTVLWGLSWISKKKKELWAFSFEYFSFYQFRIFYRPLQFLSNFMDKKSWVAIALFLSSTKWSLIKRISHHTISPPSVGLSTSCVLSTRLFWVSSLPASLLVGTPDFELPFWPTAPISTASEYKALTRLLNLLRKLGIRDMLATIPCNLCILKSGFLLFNRKGKWYITCNILAYQETLNLMRFLVVLLKPLLILE